jgi:hypothetical protein
MTTEIISPFEVLGTPIAPGVGAIVLSQGYFLQLTNLKNVPVTIDLEFASTPAFVKSVGSGAGEVVLAADIIKGNGVPPTLPVIGATVAAFLTAPIGFKAQTIPAHTTWLFGVQYIFPSTAAAPTSTAEARGVVTLKAPVGSHFLALATTRQAFFNYSAAGTLLDVAESAYSIPLVRGPEIKS